MPITRWLLVILLTSGMLPVEATPPIDPEVAAIAERVAARDWESLRDYVAGDGGDGLPKYDAVFLQLIFAKETDFLLELIRIGTLDKLNDERYFVIAEEVMFAGHDEVFAAMMSDYGSGALQRSPQAFANTFATALSTFPTFVEPMLAAGADPDMPSYGYSPLFSSVETYGRYPPVQIEGAPNVAVMNDPSLRSRLFWRLVESGADVDIALESDAGLFAAAALLGDINILDFLLLHGADINSLYEDGYGIRQSALSISLSKGFNYEPTMRFLIARGADVCVRNSRGETAYEIVRAQFSGDVRDNLLPQLECR